MCKEIKPENYDLKNNYVHAEIPPQKIEVTYDPMGYMELHKVILTLIDKVNELEKIIRDMNCKTNTTTIHNHYDAKPIELPNELNPWNCCASQDIPRNSV